MPVFKNHVALKVGRDLRLLINLEVSLEGLGPTVQRLKSRLSEPGKGPRPNGLASAREKLSERARQVVASGERGLARVGAGAPVEHQKLDGWQGAESNRGLGGPAVEEDLPVPPPEYINLVAGTGNASTFLKGGRLAARRIRGMLESNGLDMQTFDSVLDFGCGVGRIMRHWSTIKGPAFYGTDYNPDLIAWCQENLTFARFQVNDLVGKLDYEDETFDFIYSWSVFTHLTEAQQFFWIEELSRILKPGGYLFITTHGEYYVRERNPLKRHQLEQFNRGELVVVKEQRAGSNACNAFHPPSYVREKLAGNLDTIDFVSGSGEGPGTRQDGYLLRKPPTA